ncbi:hypothetical protein, partial [Yersinia pestis]
SNQLPPFILISMAVKWLKNGSYQHKENIPAENTIKKSHLAKPSAYLYRTTAQNIRFIDILFSSQLFQYH